jgi:hypothetical protein
MHEQALSIAQTAAAIVADEGLGYAMAKQMALKRLHLSAKTPLPDNIEVEEALREHIALFHADGQHQRVRVWRATALHWMQRLDAFHPYLFGAVWRGLVTRSTAVHVQLFPDDGKSVEIELLNQHVPFEIGQAPGLSGRGVDVLQVWHRSEAVAQDIAVLFWIEDREAIKQARSKDRLGRKVRGHTASVQALLDRDLLDPEQLASERT